MTEDLMEVRRCRAKSKRTGQRCRRVPAPGAVVCHFHGGATTAAKAAAKRRTAEQEARELLNIIWNADASPVTDPIAELQALAGRLRHAADALGRRLGIDELDQVAALAWLRVLRELRQALEGMERLDLESKQLELEHEKAEMVGAALIAGFHAAALTPGMVEAFMTAFRERIRGGPIVVGALVEPGPEDVTTQ